MSLGEDYFPMLSLFETSDYITRLSNLQSTFAINIAVQSPVEHDTKYSILHMTVKDYLKNDFYRNDSCAITLSNELFLTERNGY